MANPPDMLMVYGRLDEMLLHVPTKETVSP